MRGGPFDRAVFYESFKNLSDLFIAVYGEMRQQLMDRTLRVFDADDRQPVELVESSLRACFSGSFEGPTPRADHAGGCLGHQQRSDTAERGSTARDYGNLVRQRLMAMVHPDMVQEVDLACCQWHGVDSISCWPRWMQDGFQTPLDKVVRTNTLPLH